MKQHPEFISVFNDENHVRIENSAPSVSPAGSGSILEQPNNAQVLPAAPSLHKRQSGNSQIANPIFSEVISNLKYSNTNPAIQNHSPQVSAVAPIKNDIPANGGRNEYNGLSASRAIINDDGILAVTYQ